MAFMRQTWTLTKKNLKVAFVRNWFYTGIQCFWAPIIFMFFISYAKNFFVPPSKFGIGSPTPIRSLTNALGAAQGNRNKVVFVNNGYTGGDIETVIDSLSTTIRDAGKIATVVEKDVDLLTECRSTLRGASTCFGAVNFRSSPTEGEDGVWNYTIRADGSFGIKMFVDRKDNEVEIYILPLQRAVDLAIAAVNGTDVPQTIDEYPFTDKTPEEREDRIRHRYMDSIIDIIAVAFYIGVCGVTYQLTGQMASEREAGISQLVEAMAPSKKPWHIQSARLLSNHLAYDMIYMPGWIFTAILVARFAFPTSSIGIMIIFHILIGPALSSFSILGASFFHKAQLSGITVVIVGILLAIIAQLAGPFGTGAAAVLSLLFTPITYVFFIIYMARFERLSLGANLVKSPPENSWALPGIALWVFLIIQILVYPTLGAFVERWLYGTVSKERKTRTSSPDHSIILSNFSKHWTPGWFRRNVLPKFGITPPETVMAVNDFSLKVRKGQIMVLLGANGSGKSTTLDALAGINTVTSGSIEIDGTGGLGLCPQKNVMWENLTVFEHVQIFNRLKATSSTDNKDAIKQLIEACDLGLKMKAQSKTLSGGQKRKLQLAMMFTGGSRVCCVDEVSSGLDPLSRRKIWDILLAERGERTFLLTTHFLDEADVLADYLAILSRGNLKTKGTSVQLKHQVGVGYHVSVAHEQKLLGGPYTKKFTKDDRDTYWFREAIDASRFIQELREQGIKDYDVAGPTLEDVFLALADEVKENPTDHEGTELETLNSKGGLVDKQPSSDQSSELDKGLQMSKGQGTGIVKQAMILVRKRFTILKRNYFPYIAATVIPILAAGFVTLFLKNFNAPGCDPGEQSSDPKLFSIQSVDVVPLVPVGPEGAVDLEMLARRSGVNMSSLHLVDTVKEFNQYIERNFRNITPGGFFIGKDVAPLMAYVGNGNVLGGLITLNALSNSIAGIPITTSYQEFAVPFSPNTGKTLQLVLYFGLAMCAYPAFFALYPNFERIGKVRALHYSNGIRAAPLWLAYLAYDSIFITLISAIVTGIFVGASSEWYNPGYLFVVFFLYGITSALLCYVVSLVATSQLATFAVAAGGQCSFFLLYFIMYMSILTYAPAYRIDDALTLSHFIFAIFSPSANILRTMLLALNEFSLLCDGDKVASYAGAMKVYGGPILYLIVQAVVLFTVLVWWDSGWTPPFLVSTKQRKADAEAVDAVDAAVAAETKRTEESSDSLRVVHLYKSFGTNHAVQDITFGIPQGQVFALLGPNGAGKSSTISLIRGDIRPSPRGGDVLIESISITARRAAARANLGVCPQFDAMDTMTVREHLTFYARIRGVPDVASNVSAVLSATGLERFADRLAHKLSGGNKRKLSLGIALMGNPTVLLLDEPSSGMDAAAKRVMWRTLLGVAAPGRALLITTHSMEEADKLATRIGIMKRKMLTLGTTKQLGDQWGDAFVVQLVLNSAPHTTTEEMNRVKDWVTSTIPGVQLDKWGSQGGGHGQLRFRVLKESREVREIADEKALAQHEGVVQLRRNDLQSIPGLIQVLEENRVALGLEYYSVSPTTLDEVFLRVVGSEEEGEKVVKRPFWKKIIGKK